MSVLGHLRSDVLTWLLEPDSPGVRYLAMRDLLGLPENDPQLCKARQQAHSNGPIAAVLAEMDPAGFWGASGPGYNPKYRSTVWSVILLAQLGASVKEDNRISQACTYLLEHALTGNGQFTSSGAPSGTIDCLQGNLCWALTELGCQDPRLEKAYDWMARTVTGEGIAPMEDKQAPLRFYAAKYGPMFACGANNKLSCAWGAAKVMLAFSKLPLDRRTPLIERAIDAGVNFLLSVDPAEAGYPSGYSDKPSQSWWKFGFPVFYVTDILQIAEVLAELGYARDPRMERTISLLHEKQDSQGRWLLEHDYTGKTWIDFGPKKQANKWVTLRALRVMKKVVV